MLAVHGAQRSRVGCATPGRPCLRCTKFKENEIQIRSIQAVLLFEDLDEAKLLHLRTEEREKANPILGPTYLLTSTKTPTRSENLLKQRWK